MSFLGCGACTKTRIGDSLDSNLPQYRNEGQNAPTASFDTLDDDPEETQSMSSSLASNPSCLEPDPRSFDLLLVIGKGCYACATVHLARHRATSALVAVKLIHLDACNSSGDGCGDGGSAGGADLALLQRELAYHRTLCHPNLLPSLHRGGRVTGSELWTVFPLMAYGSCRDLLHAHFADGLPEAAAAIIMHDVVQALQYLHARALIHRAVKASHVLVSHTGQVALSGFHHVLSMMVAGKRRRKVHDFPNHYQGCLNWASPELLEQNMAGYDTKSDIYSLGILGCELANGVVPFADMPATQMLLEKMEGTTPRLLDTTTLPEIQMIQADVAAASELQTEQDGQQPEAPASAADTILPYQRTFTQHYHNFVELCLQTSPAQRPTATSLLQHSFFRPVRRSKPAAGSTATTAAGASGLAASSSSVYAGGLGCGAGGVGGPMGFGANQGNPLLPELLKPVSPLTALDLTALSEGENGAADESMEGDMEQVIDDMAQVIVDDWVF